MKRKNFIIAILPILFGLFFLQSCSTDDVPEPVVYGAFTDPAAVAPLDASTIEITGTSVELKWATTDSDGDAPLCDVYFGTDEDPELYKAAHTGLSLTVPVEPGLTYYWYVVMKDANGVMTTGTIWSFTIFEPIGIFVGAYNCDEPAEDYSYAVHTTKGGDTILEMDKYWNSWAATFTLDFAANTYSMPLTDFGGGYSGIESGTIDPATGLMVGSYIIYQNGASIEEGVHTYTKE